MKIKELENKKTKKHLNFKEFYKYFKKYNYNLSLKNAINMYKTYITIK